MNSNTVQVHFHFALTEYNSTVWGGQPGAREPHAAHCSVSCGS